MSTEKQYTYMVTLKYCWLDTVVDLEVIFFFPHQAGLGWKQNSLSCQWAIVLRAIVST